jgi:hypothetical protein
MLSTTRKGGGIRRVGFAGAGKLRVDVVDRPQDLATVLIRTPCRRALFEELEKVNQIRGGAVDRPTISVLAVEKPWR